MFVYYGLKNFHQNLRRYMDSRDDTQTAGRKKNLQVAPTNHIHLLYTIKCAADIILAFLTKITQKRWDHHSV